MVLIKGFEAVKEKVNKVANRIDFENPAIEEVVKSIIKQVKENGLSAINELTERLDKKKISNYKVSTVGYFAKLPTEQQKAIKLATERIRKFQTACLPKEYKLVEGNDSLEVLFRPIEAVGVYVPGGSAPLVSTLLMTVIPAQVARVERIVVISPPEIDPGILAAADYLGITEVWQIGGAQAIAALAYGISEIALAPVDKIVGPGNIYVTLAKKLVYGKVGIDSLYGPSELVIVADKNAKAKAVAHDLMSQLEHGSGYEAACLFTDSESLAKEVLSNFEEILQKQPRKESIQKAWNEFGIIGVVDDLKQCIELSNLFAPEHLELKIDNSKDYLPLVKNAGAIFLKHSNEALGDYLAGPSHCLPTGRSARFSSGLSVWDFLKRSSLVDLQPSKELIEATAVLARMEGLEAHAQAALNCEV
jgi:histidinol dehydrogenase